MANLASIPRAGDARFPELAEGVPAINPAFGRAAYRRVRRDVKGDFRSAKTLLREGQADDRMRRFEGPGWAQISKGWSLILRWRRPDVGRPI